MHRTSSFPMSCPKVKGFVGQLEMPSSSSMPHGFTCLGEAANGWNPDGSQGRDTFGWTGFLSCQFLEFSNDPGSVESGQKIWRLKLNSSWKRGPSFHWTMTTGGSKHISLLVVLLEWMWRVSSYDAWCMYFGTCFPQNTDVKISYPPGN